MNPDEHCSITTLAMSGLNGLQFWEASKLENNVAAGRCGIKPMVRCSDYKL